ncbi:MAG: CocE/NonD family hydrolase [Thermoplasmatota archaeon]
MDLKGIGVAVLLASLALAGCIEDEGGDEPLVGPATAQRLATDEWKAMLSEPLFDGTVETLHRMTAEDGTDLALTLYLPAGLPSDAQIPTLLEITPYQTLDRGLGSAFSMGGEVSPGGAWEDVVLRGAAFVRADARGGHASGGCLDFGGTADRSDARLFADWIREQPWSNGVIVTDGVSHPGMGSVVAHVADAELTAALAHAPVVSYYQDEWLQGAKFEDQLNGYLYQAIDLAPHTNPTDPFAAAAQVAPCHGQMVLDYAPVDGEFHELWQDRDLALQLENGNIEPNLAPILLTHGFVDVNVHPDHSQLYWDALPDDAPKYAIMGWWYHGWPDMDGHPAETFADIRHRWMDATLLGIDNGLWDEPRILVEDSQGTWHLSHDWPLDGSERLTFYPDGEALAEAPGAEGSLSYEDTLETYRNDWDGSVSFATEPLPAARLVTGAPTLHLTASSSHDATKWVVYLFDEAPDGSRTRITHGYADSHLREPRTPGWEPLTPGEADTWTIPLQPTAVVLEEGHRLVLMVASQDSRNMDALPTVGSTCMEDFRGGCYDPSGILPATSVGQATNTVHTGPEGTWLELAWVDPAATMKATE